MTKFIYKMENILEIKSQLEEQAKTAYSNAKLEYDREESILQKLIDKQKLYQDKLINSIQDKIKLIKIHQCEEALKLYQLYINQQEKRVSLAYKKVESTRKALQEAMIERKTHEKLKEKALNDYMLEYEAWEKKEIDELISYRYGTLTQSKEGFDGSH
jgi:flagellar protein FliJ